MNQVEMMGKVVTVYYHYERSFQRRPNGEEYREYKVKPLPKELSGWVTGFRSLQNGFYRSGSYEDPPTLQQTERVRCVLVCVWPTQRPLMVPYEAIRLGGVPRFPSAYEWTERDRELLRKEVKSYPRDKNGRFVKTELKE